MRHLQVAQQTPSSPVAPRTEPTRCRGGGSAGQSRRRGCPWTRPGWSPPWPNTQCATLVSPENPAAAETLNDRSSPPTTTTTQPVRSRDRGPTFPHGESHDGSPGLDAFHKAKSLGDFFSLNLSAEMLRSPAEKSAHPRQRVSPR